MKPAKSFTDGLAILLAVLLLIYLLTCYIKYNPGEEALLEESKLTLFFESSVHYRQHLYLTLMLSMSVAVGMILRKRPGFCLLFSCAPLCYALTMYASKDLTVHPMIIILGCLAHTAGSIFFAAAEDRRLGKNFLSNGGLLCTLSALALSTACTVRQSAAASVASIVKEMETAGINLPSKIHSNTDVIRRIYDLYIRRGTSYASGMAGDYSREFEAEGIKLYYLGSIKGEQLSVYIRLSLILFGLAVLWFFLRRRHRGLAALIAFIPPVYLFINLLFDRVSAMPLMLMALTLIAAVCAAADFDQHGKIPVSELERQQFLEEMAEKNNVNHTPKDGVDVDADADADVDADANADAKTEDKSEGEGENEDEDEDKDKDEGKKETKTKHPESDSDEDESDEVYYDF